MNAPGKDYVQYRMARFYSRLFSLRQRGDYDDLVTFGREDVMASLDEAKSFVAEVLARIERDIAEETRQGE